MPINLSIPLTGEKKTVKDHVITILSTEWPLSSRKIYNTLTKKYNLAVSYQAVHKAIKELLESNIIVRDSKELKLNLDWIKEVKDFGENIGEMYENGNNKLPDLNLADNELHLIKFSSIAELDKFIYYGLIKGKSSEDRPDKCYNYWNYEYWPFFLMEEMIEFSAMIPHKENFFTILRNNTIVEKWAKKFYEKIGLNVRIGLNVANFDFAVFGNQFYQIFFPEALMKKLDKIFLNVKNSHDVDLEELKSIREEQNDIYMIFGKNKIIAEQLTKLFLSYFNGKGNVEHDIVEKGEIKDSLSPEADGNELIVDLDKHNFMTFTFSKLFDSYKFMLNELIPKVHNKMKSDTCCVIWDHIFMSLIGSSVEQENFRNVLQNVKYNYIICRNDTPMDRFLSKFYKDCNKNVKVKFGVDMFGDIDLIIRGDYIIRIYFPADLVKDLDINYSTSDISQANFGNMYNHIFKKSYNICISVEKNPALAEQIRQEIIGQFKAKNARRGPELTDIQNYPQSMVFNSIHDVDRFILNFLVSNCTDKKQDLFLYWINSWIPLFIEKETYKKIVEVVRNYKLYPITKNKTNIEIWCKKVAQAEVDEKIGIDLEMPDTLVLNNMVLQVFYPDQVKNEIFEAYSKTSDINKLNIDKLFHTIFEKKVNIPVVIQRNKELAEEIKETIKKQFA